MKIKFHKVLIGLGVGVVLSLSSCGLKNPPVTSKINPTDAQGKYTIMMATIPAGSSFPAGSIYPYPLFIGITKILLKKEFPLGTLSKTQCPATIKKNMSKMFSFFITFVCINIKIFNQMKEPFQSIEMGDNFVIHVKGFNSLQSCRTYTKSNGTCYRFYKIYSLIQMLSIVNTYVNMSQNEAFKNYYKAYKNY